jgi:hypothetical protein
MKVEHKGKQSIIKDTQGDCDLFLEKLSHELHAFSAQNLIIDLTPNDKVTNATIKQFVTVSKQHKKNKLSFVLVAKDIDFTSVPAALTVVPSILEAHDIIEMEEIERDLGF